MEKRDGFGFFTTPAPRHDILKGLNGLGSVKRIMMSRLIKRNNPRPVMSIVNKLDQVPDYFIMQETDEPNFYAQY